MRRFKIPLIATGVILALMLVVGAASIAWIANSDGSKRKRMERASMAGTAVATVGCIAIAPFWLYAAAKFGEERRRLKRQT